MAAGSRVFRMIYAVEPVQDVPSAEKRIRGLVSVALPAENARHAEEQARRLLPPTGWQPVGSPARTSDLSEILASVEHAEADSAYGSWAEDWLRSIHTEALTLGASLHLLWLDGEYLDHPRPLATL